MITIYSKNDCPYCVDTKKYLILLDIPFEEINISENEEARKFIKETENHKTVPQIYKNGKLFIQGGYNGLVSADPEILL